MPLIVEIDGAGVQVGVLKWQTMGRGAACRAPHAAKPRGSAAGKVRRQWQNTQVAEAVCRRARAA